MKTLPVMALQEIKDLTKRLKIKKTTKGIQKKKPYGVFNEKRTPSTMTKELPALSDWMAREGTTHVAMESTGAY
ncbi:MAG: hypothetical protein DYG83_16120 [Candidatus Brocadia sp. AMX2]|uniref:Uncharacterized protein n=1 Tax=Candidatus Brocadia sinica JPN1 TaxID=1197129 RepID=A0ABQ0K0L9_9BACT|nr:MULTISPECIES: hypothetical protein [Brocadia]KXK29131.1 MAG: hypothetical protein UZ01_02296 [Candidatus Brocadia sinica]MBC6933577.1 hypothetical protein [Candidatus Brocadia sp.]MBL1170378.1 hypothetical protein [Candidatus Brocadia sp. AMX1]NOG42317.1 hypothetical protein [Planctomycetota bacterium]MCE7868310.1 hypothetical protein [Candidatus Brocadia sp. AMX2]